MISYTTSLLNKAMDGAVARGKLKGKAATSTIGPEDIMFLVRKVRLLQPVRLGAVSGAGSA